MIQSLIYNIIYYPISRSPSAAKGPVRPLKWHSTPSGCQGVSGEIPPTLARRNEAELAGRLAGASGVLLRGNVEHYYPAAHGWHLQVAGYRHAWKHTIPTCADIDPIAARPAKLTSDLLSPAAEDLKHRLEWVRGRVSIFIIGGLQNGRLSFQDDRDLNSHEL